jgi:hypothetical protein
VTGYLLSQYGDMGDAGLFSVQFYPGNTVSTQKIWLKHPFFISFVM